MNAKDEGEKKKKPPPPKKKKERKQEKESVEIAKTRDIREFSSIMLSTYLASVD